MGMNELMITELVVRNILTKLTPAEGAALLSALVYRVKIKETAPDYQNLPSTLIKVRISFLVSESFFQFFTLFEFIRKKICEDIKEKCVAAQTVS